MERNFNFYIHGNSKRSSDIRDAFELQGYDVDNWSFKTGFYFTFMGKIHNVPVGSMEMRLVLSNPEYKELRLKPHPKYQVGDAVIFDMMIVPVRDIKYHDSCQMYMYKVGNHNWVLEEALKLHQRASEKKFAIGDLHAGQLVLVRHENNSNWAVDLFGYIKQQSNGVKFFCTGNCEWSQCVPLQEDTERLLGTNDPCEKKYVIW